jgi:chromosome transmission fidelity protein 18
MSSYSPGIPSSFDPALLYSELELERLQNAPPSTSFSDDIEALQQCITEDTTKKNSEGVVIQHRAWNIADVFRSEGEATLGTATSRAWQRLY